MPIDINLLGMWGRLQRRVRDRIYGPVPTDQPTTPMMQYLYLEDIRETAARII